MPVLIRLNVRDIMKYVVRNFLVYTICNLNLLLLRTNAYNLDQVISVVVQQNDENESILICDELINLFLHKVL